uniref:Tetrahydrofolate dehydrogenase/cyclohydrolase NAD(P)-binding domain-containing protein n=1 Tax=Pseudo-nitzschia arenysensis TaxID=697910 RepID=A0A7R9ZU14_9STRA|mmetsp:Transcript_646/g.1527  ORF Transcript_646/g.1527 Transcript_646/m.1527 type:complete len:426 (+) Transcript_646:139-1416(+)
MIPKTQQLRKTVFPLVGCASQWSSSTTNYSPTTLPSTFRSNPRIRSLRCYQQYRSLSSSPSKESTPGPPLDWNELYPSPSAIDVTPLAESLRSKVREFTKNERQLKLIGLLTNEGSHRLESEIYSDRIQQTFEEDGIDYKVWKYPETGQNLQNKESQNERLRWIQEKIQRINTSSDIDGALVFYPIHPFGQKGPYKNKLTGVYYKTQDDHIQDMIHPSKDVEGLCGTKWFQIRNSKQKDPPSIYPCTALSVLKILEEYHIRGKNTKESKNDHEVTNRSDGLFKESRCWKDQTISIVNRSGIMGRPLAVMLAEKGATVYSIDIDSILQFRPNGKRLRRCNPSKTTLESCLEESTVVVAGVPCEDFRIPLDRIQQGSTIVSVSEFPNVCEETLFAERPDIAYIPQVGKVTVATLSLNLLNLKKKRED